MRAELINSYPDAFDLLYAFNKKLNRQLSEEELIEGIDKFLKYGHAIAIIKDRAVIAFMNLYCNNYDTLEAYINNTYVLEEYRGQGISNLLMEKALEICRINKFRSIKLHVISSNARAVNLYTKYGFVFNGKKKTIAGNKLDEMEKIL